MKWKPPFQMKLGAAQQMSGNKPRIVFLGSNLNPISLGCLKAIAAGNRYDFLVGIDQQDKSAWPLVKMNWRRHGLRGMVSRIMKRMGARARIFLQPVGPDFQDGRCLREVAELQGMESFNCSSVNGPDVRQIIKTFDPDLIIVANFSQIIRSEVREIPKLGIIRLFPTSGCPFGKRRFDISNDSRKSGSASASLPRA